MDYQSNAKKDREKGVAKPEKKIEKVITGVVTQKPKNVGRKFKDVFFGGDAKQVAGYVGSDVLLPALRNLLVDMITRGVEGLIYGQRSSNTRRDPRTNYGAHYSINPGPRSPFDPRTPNLRDTPPRGRVNRHEVNDIVLASRAEAELVVERLCDVLETYEVVSLADLYDLLGLQSSHIDHKWGWTFIHNVPIRQIRQGYLLELPPLEEI